MCEPAVNFGVRTRAGFADVDFHWQTVVMAVRQPILCGRQWRFHDGRHGINTLAGKLDKVVGQS